MAMQQPTPPVMPAGLPSASANRAMGLPPLAQLQLPQAHPHPQALPLPSVPTYPGGAQPSTSVPPLVHAPGSSPIPLRLPGSGASDIPLGALPPMPVAVQAAPQGPMAAGSGSGQVGAGGVMPRPPSFPSVGEADAEADSSERSPSSRQLFPEAGGSGGSGASGGAETPGGRDGMNSGDLDGAASGAPIVQPQHPFASAVTVSPGGPADSNGSAASSVAVAVQAAGWVHGA